MSKKLLKHFFAASCWISFIKLQYWELTNLADYLFPSKENRSKSIFKTFWKAKAFQWMKYSKYIYTCKPKIDNQIFFLVSLVGSWWNKPETFPHFGTRHFLFFSKVPVFFNFFRRGLLESSLVNFAFPLCNALSWVGVMGTKPLGLICYE